MSNNRALESSFEDLIRILALLMIRYMSRMLLRLLVQASALN